MDIVKNAARMTVVNPINNPKNNRKENKMKTDFS